jgi:hypothetical protein
MKQLLHSSMSCPPLYQQKNHFKMNNMQAQIMLDEHWHVPQ